MTTKRELIKQYKQTPPEMGIFQIKNKINGKIFIGRAMNLPGIINSNKFQLKMKSHYIKELQEDYNKHGESNFEFEKLDTLKHKEDVNVNHSDELETLEQMWLEKLQPYGEKGYNTKTDRL